MMIYVFIYFAVSFVISIIILVSLEEKQFDRMTFEKFLALWLTLPIFLGMAIAKGIKDLFKEGL